MCNFIIRPIKSYATVDVMASKVVADVIPTTFENYIIKQGTSFDVKRVDGGFVYGNVDEFKSEVAINLSDMVHTFSDKDPSKKDDKKSK